MKKGIMVFAGAVCSAAFCVFGALKDANGNAVTEKTPFGDVDGETGTVGDLVRAGGAAATNEIPTKVSQLKNDSEFITPEQVEPSRIYRGFARQAEFAVDANFAKYVTWSGVTSKPTTIEGYGITNVYTKAEVDAKGYVTEAVTNGLATTAQLRGEIGAATNGLLRTESDPTVPAWAKAAKKPAYTASEVGALVSTVTHLSGDVPTTRKVNGKALSADVTLGAADVGAYTKAQADANVAESVASATNALAGRIVAPETIATNLVRTVLASSLFNLTYDPMLQVTWRKEADGGVFYERCYTNVNMTGVAP